MIEFKLRPYQEEDVCKKVTLKRVINANPPGTGKTLEALEVRNRVAAKKTLIVSPKIALGVWRDEARKFFDWDSGMYTGTPKKRQELWEEWTESNCDILITNFAMLKEILAKKSNWNMIIVDEAHLGGLLNHKTGTWKLMKEFTSEYLYLLTGTPIRRGPHDLFGMLHLIDNKKFTSYWGFVNRYCHVHDNGFGKEVLPKPKNPIQFNNMLKLHMIRHRAADVLTDLPEKVRGVTPISMTKKQLKSYKSLEKDMMLETKDDFILTPNAMTLLLRLRQLLVCPKMIGVDDNGAAINALVNDLLPNDFDDGRAVLIATPFRQAIPFLRSEIESKFKDVIIEEIHGGIKETSSDVALRFQSHKTHRKVLLYTIKSGASWTATDASVCYFLGAEWNNSDNCQAEARCHRIGQKRLVDIRYLLTEDSVDIHVSERLNEKAMAEAWVLNPQRIMQIIKDKYK